MTSLRFEQHLSSFAVRLLAAGMAILITACHAPKPDRPSPAADRLATSIIDSAQAVNIAIKSFSEVSETDPKLLYVASFARDSTGFVSHLATRHPPGTLMLGGTETVHVRYDGKIDNMIIEQ